MHTTRGLDRLVFFTDAITAIAITLLILPLSDAVLDAAKAGDSPTQFLSNNSGGLFAFVLSFLVIARLWTAHHAAFEYVKAYNSPLLLLNLLWAATVVFLPLPTEMLAQFRNTPTTIGIYIGTMALSSVTLTVMVLVIRGNPQLERDEKDISARTTVGFVATTVSVLIALVLGVFVPVINFWALLLLFFTSPVQRIYDRRTARRHASAETDKA